MVVRLANGLRPRVSFQALGKALHVRASLAIQVAPAALRTDRSRRLLYDGTASDRSLSFRPCETKTLSQCQGKRMSPTANDHGEYEGQAALYAAGALSASDALAFETHAADCALCAQEFHSLQPVIRTLGSLAAKVPPPTASAAPSGPCQPRSSLDPGLAAVDGRSSSSSLLNPSG